jgi:hypothetical protein
VIGRPASRRARSTKLRRSKYLKSSETQSASTPKTTFGQVLDLAMNFERFDIVEISAADQTSGPCNKIFRSVDDAQAVPYDDVDMRFPSRLHSRRASARTRPVSIFTIMFIFISSRAAK